MANTNLVGMKYMDMPEDYRDEYSKADFKRERRDEKRRMLRDAIAEPAASRMAGDRVFELVKGEEFKKDDREGLLGSIDEMKGLQEAGGEIDEQQLEELQAKLGRFDRRAAAQEEFVPGKIDTYNFDSFGKTKDLAGLYDIEYLASRGFDAQQIKDAIASKGVRTSKKGQLLLDKYTKGLIDSDTPVDSDTPANTPSPEMEVAPELITSGDMSPIVGNNTIGDGGMNYGVMNSGVINDIRNYGGGYSQGENNTGLAQAYIDQMEENWNDYSGPRYGAMITDSRVKMADRNNPINTAGLYANIGLLGQNMYDKGLIGKAQMYGDPYSMPSATYPEFPDLGFIEEEEES